MAIKFPVVFCPKCDDLIWDSWVCSRCGWQRTRYESLLGARKWGKNVGTKTLRGPASLALPEDYVVVAGYRGEVVILDKRDGGIISRWQAEPEMVVTGVKVWQDKIVVTCCDERPVVNRDMTFALINAGNGIVSWHLPIRSTSLSLPLIKDDLAYFVAATTESAELYAVDLQSRSVRIHKEIHAWDRSAPAYSKGIICVGVGTSKLIAIDAASFHPRWQFHTVEKILYVVAHEQGEFVAVTNDRAIYRLQAETGQVLWTMRSPGGYTCAPTMSPEGFYIAGMEEWTGDPNLYAYRMLGECAELRWMAPLEANLEQAPLLVGEHLISAEGGNLHVRTQSSGNIILQQAANFDICTNLVSDRDTFFVAERGGVASAIYWKQPSCLEEAPSAYAERHQWEMAGLAYTLQGAWLEAATCFEKSQWFGRAMHLYKKAGDESGVARSLEHLQQFREAGHIWRSIDDLPKAANAYLRGKFYDLALDMLQQMNDAAAIQDLLARMPSDEHKALLHETRHEYEEAAHIWEMLGKWREAGNAYARVGNAELAAQCFRRAESWDDLISLARSQDQWDLLAEALQRKAEHAATLDEQLWLEAAQAYSKTAQHTGNSFDPDDNRREVLLAGLHEAAAHCYKCACDWEEAREHERLVSYYRHWPALAVELSHEKELTAGQFEVLNLVVRNIGYGTTHDINLYLSGAVDLASHAIQGLKKGNVYQAQLSVRCCEKINDTENIGKSLLKISIDYVRSDKSGARLSMDKYVPVVRPGNLAGELKNTIIFTEKFIAHAGSVIDGHQYTGPVQTGDRVSIYRPPSNTLCCPNLLCGFTLDQYQNSNYCPACGQALKQLVADLIES